MNLVLIGFVLGSVVTVPSLYIISIVLARALTQNDMKESNK